jgi:DNA-binding CsgD family transcriptional regulator
MKDSQWNTIMLREFESLACLSDEEKIVLHDWAYGKTVVQTAMRCHMGETKVKDIRKQLREKYDGVQAYTPLLPKRT